jgi:hypothetical protein
LLIVDLTATNCIDGRVTASQMAAISAAWANIPPKRNRKDPICFSPYPYRTRNLIERFLNKARPRMCPLFISGPIGLGDRKSVQPMAARPAPGNYDQLHHFIADGVWDAAPLESSYRWSCCCACRSRRHDVRHRSSQWNARRR